MFVHTKSKSLLLQAPEPGMLIDMMPSRLIQGNGYNIAVKHTEETTKALRAKGFAAPSPIMSYYDWPKYRGMYAPFAHQKAMAEFHTMHRRMFNLSEMGTAKTNANLWAADYLMNTGDVKRALIVAPLSTLERVWQVGIFETLMHRTCAVVHGSREKRRKMLSIECDFYIINPDGLKIKEIRDLIARRGVDLIIVDEGSLYRNSNTDKYRALEKIVGDKRLWWNTGTPTPGGPSDAWAQARLVNPLRVPKTFGAFRRDTMFEVSEHNWKPRPEGRAIAYNAMQPAIRFEKSECLELPTVTTMEVQADLSTEQVKAFTSMVNDMVMEHQQAANDNVTINAVNAGDKVNKLRQILLGSIKSPDGSYLDLDCKPRLAALVEACEMAQGKIIVIVPFKGAMDLVARHLRAQGFSSEVINGDVPIARRNRIIADYKTLDDPKVLVCHPQVMAHGLNLTEADVLIFFGPIYSNDEYRQVVERFNRPGQTRKMTIVRIGCHALDWKIYAMPDSKEQVQSAILAMYRDVVLKKAA